MKTKILFAVLSAFAVLSILALAGCGDLVTAPTSLPVQPYGPVAVPAGAVTGNPAELPRPGDPLCSSMPPFGGTDVLPPVGGCFAPGKATRAEVQAFIDAYPQDTWGLSGKGYAWAEQLLDGTWHIAVTRRR